MSSSNNSPGKPTPIVETDLDPANLSAQKNIVRRFYKDMWDKHDTSIIPPSSIQTSLSAALWALSSSATPNSHLTCAGSPASSTRIHPISSTSSRKGARWSASYGFTESKKGIYLDSHRQKTGCGGLLLRFSRLRMARSGICGFWEMFMAWWGG